MKRPSLRVPNVRQSLITLVDHTWSPVEIFFMLQWNFTDC